MCTAHEPIQIRSCMVGPNNIGDDFPSSIKLFCLYFDEVSPNHLIYPLLSIRKVMPALLIKLRPTEEGWSKPHHDDLVEKLFTATFPAFKFPDRDRLHVSCGVQLCRGECPKVDCRSDEPFVLSTEKQLARIEIFNSLAVTAPQIELDRLQSEKRTNYSGKMSEMGLE